MMPSPNTVLASFSTQHGQCLWLQSNTRGGGRKLEGRKTPGSEDPELCLEEDSVGWAGGSVHFKDRVTAVLNLGDGSYEGHCQSYQTLKSVRE